MNLLGKDNAQCSYRKLPTNCVQFTAAPVLNIFNNPVALLYLEILLYPNKLTLQAKLNCNSQVYK